MTEAQVQELKDHITDQINSMREEMIPNMYTVQEVCKKLQISKRTFYRWQNSETPVFTIVQRSGVKRIPRSSVEKFIETYRVKGKH